MYKRRTGVNLDLGRIMCNVQMIYGSKSDWHAFEGATTRRSDRQNYALSQLRLRVMRWITQRVIKKQGFNRLAPYLVRPEQATAKRNSYVQMHTITQGLPLVNNRLLQTMFLLLQNESANSIAIAGPNSQITQVRRSDIEEGGFKRNIRSMMPTGL